MKRFVLSIFLASSLSVITSYSQVDDYTGKPWNNTFQVIPGRLQCELYDLGSEGVAYHDADSVNNGSGRLNPANGDYFNEFRMHEGVDISYTKSNDIDNNQYNIVEPKMNQLYVGWTTPGEWINYSVEVKQTGNYYVGLMYTSNGDGGISLLIDGKDITGTIHVTSTHNDKDTVAWRQWHHWNRIESITTVHLETGLHLLTLNTVLNGNMNFDYLEFKLKNER
jgi:hypothetical protein